MTGAAPMPKAYSYLRFSTPEQMKGDSYRRQNALTQEWLAKNKDVELGELTFHDLGVSAFRGKNAETGKLGEFKAAVECGMVERGSFLLVESLDRLSRQAARKAQRLLEDLCELGITVVTLSDGRTYHQELLEKDPFSLIMSLLIFIRANEESARKSGLLQAAWTGKREQATSKPMTAKCPGWLRLNRDTGKWDVIPERAAIVQRVYRETLEGRGQRAITAGLNRDGIPLFGKAGRWHRSYTYRLLNNPAVMGTFTPHTSDWKDGKRLRKPIQPLPGYFPAIVDPETFQRVQAMGQGRSSPARGSNAGRDVQNIFGGLLACPRCGARMNMINKGVNSRRYVVCRRARAGMGCTYESVPYETLKQALLHDAEALLCDPRAGGAEGDSVQAQLDLAANTLEAVEDYLAHLWETHRTNRLQSILGEIKETEAEREVLRKRIRELAARRDVVLGPFVERRAQEALEALRAEPMDRKRVNALFRSLFTRVTVNHDRGTLEFVWKGGGCSSVLYAFPKDSAVAA
ncbi:hypothetical protein BON30_48075 [Cystobacter ferrugineus]|uniref:Recombinase family protein n=2 Tax=Cystobacter ferrugineus TaxID=83449 RepID=A0A1L9AU76_9BACT|nr:hypothetical protein BON30_48075 [Cystobacter ferrugineus]